MSSDKSPITLIDAKKGEVRAQALDHGQELCNFAAKGKQRVKIN
jgi:hypothetical protein